MLTIKFKAIFIEFLNVVDISFNLPRSHILNINYDKHLRRMSNACLNAMFKRMPNVALTTYRSFLWWHGCSCKTKVPLTHSSIYRQIYSDIWNKNVANTNPKTAKTDVKNRYAQCVHASTLLGGCIYNLHRGARTTGKSGKKCCLEMQGKAKRCCLEI